MRRLGAQLARSVGAAECISSAAPAVQRRAAIVGSTRREVRYESRSSDWRHRLLGVGARSPAAEEG
eukprot:6180608-Pleurochrysis_carterae.AAC.2